MSPPVQWSGLSRRQRAGLLVLGAARLSLALAAWRDLARRPSAQVNGRKALWAVVIAVNWIGPLSYVRWGRRPGDRRA